MFMFTTVQVLREASIDKIHNLSLVDRGDLLLAVNLEASLREQVVAADDGREVSRKGDERRQGTAGWTTQPQHGGHLTQVQCRQHRWTPP